MALTLNQQEIKELTGRNQRRTQIAALDQMRIPYRVRPDGWPVVAVADLNFRKPETRSEPDFDSIAKKVGSI